MSGINQGEVKVSVAVPVYNTGKYVTQCLRSIMGQTLKEIEIIVVNDGSTDDSLQQIKALQQEDSRIIVHDYPFKG